MNAETNAVAQSRVASSEAEGAWIAVGRRMYWSVKREFWDNRSLYLAPMAVAAVFLLGFLVRSSRSLNIHAAGLTPMEQAATFAQTYDFVALVLMGTTFVVALFYCIEALQGERRDRSILFWKSLPVSDGVTVLSKAIVPLLLLPLLTFAITFATQCIMLLLSAAILLASGQSLAMLSHLSLGQRWVGLFSHLVGGHGLWYAPIYGFLLLVSAWARRAAFLWAVLPPLAIGVLEKILFNSSHFASMLGSRIAGADTSPAMATGVTPMVHGMPLEHFASPGFWIGLALTAACLWGAVRLRRYRGPN
jgi:ABC-2 type transport system permease protein